MRCRFFKVFKGFCILERNCTIQLPSSHMPAHMPILQLPSSHMITRQTITLHVPTLFTLKFTHTQNPGGICNIGAPGGIPIGPIPIGIPGPIA